MTKLDYLNTASDLRRAAYWTAMGTNQKFVSVLLKNLEEKLGEQFNIKRNAYAKDQSQKWGVIEDTVIKIIKEVSSSKKFDLVLNKQVVIDGGSDITDEVIKKLNTQSKSSSKK